MNILYIGYWNVDDPLTVATIHPSLKILRELLPDATIVFANIQREPAPVTLPEVFDELRISYSTILSGNNLWNKINDFWYGPTIVHELCVTRSVTYVIARGAPAGALAYLVWKKNKIPFFVESFEPHADYMLESKVWSKFDLRYFLQKYWEGKQKKYASGLLPVTVNYKTQLLKELISEEKIRVAPCGVNESLFSFNEAHRLKLRKDFGIPDQGVVGLYTGKYSGLYLAEDAFRIYRIFFDQLPEFYLIILSASEYHSWINHQIAIHGLPSEKIFVKSVKHNEVGNYCSASDFAFATIKESPSQAYSSPVKVGEYWVNGLPVLMTNGIGDESSIIESGFGGVLFEESRINSTQMTEKIERIMELVKTPGIRRTISLKGVQLRSFEKLKIAYKYFLLER